MQTEKYTLPSLFKTLIYFVYCQWVIKVKISMQKLFPRQKIYFVSIMYKI